MSLIDQSEAGIGSGALEDSYYQLMSLFLDQKYYRPFHIAILRKPHRMIHTEAPKQFCKEESFEQCLRQTKAILKQKLLENLEDQGSQDEFENENSPSEDFGFENLPGALKHLENFKNLAHSNRIIYQKPLRFGWLLNADGSISELSVSESDLDAELGGILHRFSDQYNILVLKLESDRFADASLGCWKFSEPLIGMVLKHLSLDRTYLHGQDLSAVFKMKVEHISLRFCCLEDEDISVFSKSLSLNDSVKALNLNFNRIHNEGCKYLARSLRLNRTLKCLSLMHNEVNNTGCEYFLSILKMFYLTREEVLAVRKVKLDEHIELLKKTPEPEPPPKVESIVKVEEPKKPPHAKGKSAYGISKSKASLTSESIPNESKSEELIEDQNLDVAVTVKYSWDRNGAIYSEGNFHLSHLCLSHNSLTPSILPEVLALLRYQQGVTSQGKGLVDLSIRNDVIDVDMAGLLRMLSADSVAQNQESQ